MIPHIPLTREALVLAALTLLPITASQAQTTGTWNPTPTTGLTWNTAANWTGLTGNLVPDAVDATPNLTGNIGTTRTITLDGSKMMGTLTIDDPTATFVGYTLNAGSPSTSQVIFDVSAGSAALNLPTTGNTVTNAIGAGITLNDPLVITSTKTNVNGTLNLNGIITDGASSYSITKAGNGIVQLAAANDYNGGTFINGGRLGAGNAASYSSGSVTVASGGQAWLSSGATYANNISIAGTGYANTADAGALNGALRFGGATTSGTINLTADARIGAYNGASGTLAGPLTGSANLEINQIAASHNGNILLTGNAAGYTGTVTVSQGTLRLGPASNLGGSLVVNGGANLYAEGIGAAGSATVGTDSGAPRSLTLGGATGANLFIDPSTGDSLQVNGNLILNGTNTVTLTGEVASNPVTVLTYSGSVTGNSSNLTLPGGLAAYRPGTGFTVGSGQITLALVLGELTWTGATNNSWNTTDANWKEGITPATFYNLDSVTFNDSAATNAVLTTALTGTHNDLTFTALTAGVGGEAITVQYADPLVANSPLSVSVAGNAITVNLATDSLNALVSTAAGVKAVIEGSVAASALVSVANVAANDGTGLVAVLAATPLALPTQSITIPTGISVAPGAMTFANNALDYSVAGPGNIIGGGSLTKDGSGMLTVTSANSFAGGTTLNSGGLRAGSATAFGTGPLRLLGGQFSSDSTTARTLSNPLVLNGSLILGDAVATGAVTLSGAATLAGNIVINGPAASTVSHTLGGLLTDGASSFSLTSTGFLILNGANTYDGGTLIQSGRLNGGNPTAYGTGAVTVSNGAQAYLTVAGTFANNFSLAGIGFSESAGNLGALRLQSAAIASGNITLTDNTRIGALGVTNTISGTISGSIGQAGGSWELELANASTTGDCTMILSGNNSYGLGTNVTGAIVVATHNNAFGTGPITLKSNNTVARTTRVELGTNVVLPPGNSFVLDSDAVTGVAAITSYAGDLVTASTAIVNGPVEILRSVGGGGHFASNKGSNSVLRLMGAVTSPNAASVVVRQGVVEMGGGGSYGAIQIVDGTLRLAANNGLATEAILSVGTSGTAADTGTFDLNGFSQSLAGLLKGPRTATVTNSAANPSTLTLDLAVDSTYAGTFANGAATLSLVKSGAGTLTLSAASPTLTGNLSVTGGGLNLTGSLGGSGSLAATTTLSGEGFFAGNLALTDATIRVEGSTVLALETDGNLNVVGGTVTVNLLSLPAVAAPIPIIGYDGSLTGSVANFQLANAANYRSPGFSVVAGVPNFVTLTLGAAVDLTWTGSGGNSDWNVNTTSNWANGALAPSTFFYADNVSFGDAPATDPTINVPGTVSAGAMVFTNASRNYTFSGSGTVAAATVSKSGGASVTFESAVNFPGTIALNAGTLRFSPPTGVTTTLAGALSGSGTLVKGGDGILSLPNANPGFTGSVVIAKGELIPGNSTALGTAPINFGDATTLATDVSTLTLNTGVTLANTPVTVAATCLDARISSTGGTIGGTTITKKGAGVLRIGHATNPAATANVLTGTSPITIEQGTLAGTSMTPISSSTTITMGNADTGTAQTVLEVPASQSGTNDFVTLSCPLVLSASAPNSEAIIRYAGGPSVLAPSFSGPVSLNGRDLYLENTSGSNLPTRLYNVSGAISGNGNVRVRAGTLPSGEADGATRLRIIGTSNTFTGDLYIQKGNLQTGFSTTAGSEHIPNSALLIMSAGTSMGLATTAETIRGLVGGAATVAIPFTAAISQGRGDANLCRLTVSDSNAANSHVFDGKINDGGASIALTKAGAATQVLNGPCAFTGTTLHNAGKLIINNSYASAITVAAAATLGGNMISTAAITATAAGAKIAPGNSTGTMTAASAALNTGGILDLEIDDASTPKNDKLVVTGALNVTSATLNLTIAGTAAEPVYVLASYGTLTGTFGTVSGKPSNYNLILNYNDGVSSNNIALVKQSDPYLAWFAAYPAITGADRAPDVDFDKDGVSNGIEFVIGSDPTLTTTAGLPAGSVNGGNLVFTCKRSDASKAYAVTVEHGTTLATWPGQILVPTSATAGPPVTVVDNGAAPDDVTVLIPLASDPKKFARLRADIPFTP